MSTHSSASRRVTRRSVFAIASLVAIPGFVPAGAMAAEVADRVERPDLATTFSSLGVIGTIAVYEPTARRLTLVDATLAEQRFIPASTFKLANSLIALETGVVKDENEVIPYGGKPQWNKAWEQDMPLRTAMPLSNVAIFQEIARRVGLARYREWLAILGYGNQQIGTIVDEFWLKGPLQISAVEQAIFAGRLARKELPMSQRSQSIVHEISRLESKDGKTLHGKTGWAVGVAKIGWLTGWVNANPGVTSFSLNIDMPTMADAPKRMDIAKRVLGQLGKY